MSGEVIQYPWVKLRINSGWFDGRTGIITPVVGGARIADTLNFSNTGYPVGTVFTDRAGGTFNSSNNGQVITAKRFTSRIILDHVTGLTFRNCYINFHDWFAVISVSNDTSTGVLFDHCTFDGGSNPATWFDPAQDMTVLGATGVTLYRCKILNFDNAFRPQSNCTMDSCLAVQPTMLAGSHVDGVEMYGGGGAPGSTAVNNTIINSWIDARGWPSGYGIGTPVNSWSGGSGGVTAAVNCTCDFSSTDGIVIENNNLFGGAYTCYLTPHISSPSQVPTDIEFIGNHIQGYGSEGGPVLVDDPGVTRIKYWEGNIDMGMDGSESDPLYIPGLGTDRPRP